jgi:short-subunit dehydrogenase
MRAPFRAIVITGASSGLGAALAAAYARPGAVLGLVGRDRERLDATAKTCGEAGATVDCAAIDVADRDATAAWLDAFDRAHQVDLIVANAGISSGPDPDGFEPPEITARQINVNLLGAVHTVMPLLPAMRARGGGRVALIASLAALRGLPYSPGYCASKAGLRVYGEALRPLVEPHGIGVTVVCSGFFASPMTDRWDGPTPFLWSAERAARRVKRGIDRGRRRVTFPSPLALGLRLCDLMPAAIGDRIVRNFRFRIRSP